MDSQAERDESGYDSRDPVGAVPASNPDRLFRTPIPLRSDQTATYQLHSTLVR